MQVFPQMAQGQQNANVIFNELGVAVAWALVYGTDPNVLGALHRGYLGIGSSLGLSSGALVTEARWGGFDVDAVDHTFGASTTTYVSVDRADGTLDFSTSDTNYLDATNFAQVETVVTGASAITSVIDDRGGPGGVHGGGGGGGGGGDLLAANNLSDVANAATARTNLGVDTAIAAAVAGLSWKQAVRAATTTAGTLASSFENGDTIDGVVLATGNRILIKNQSSGAENGIYVVAASGAPTRATDADSGAELVNASVYVSEGTTLADTQWTCTTNATITVGSTALAFAQLSTGGGGGLTNFTEAANSSSPNASVPVVSLTATNAAADVDAAIVPKGANGSLLTAVPDGTSAGGDKRGNAAIDLQLSRSASTQVASGNNSIAIGRKNTAGLAQSIAIGDTNTASGTSAVAIGSSNTASAQGAVAIGSFSGTAATGAGSVAIGGSGGAASNSWAVKLGGNALTASGSESAAIGGESNTASGTASACIGGQNNFASGAHSVAFGYAAHTRGMYACIAQGVQNLATAEDIQAHRMVLGMQTTNAMQATMVADGGAASAANQLMLSNTSARTVFGTITALQGSTGDAAGWTFACVVKRGANAAATALVGAATATLVAADAGAATWAVSITVDTTNGTLAVKVTGEAAKTIKWTAVLTAGYVG